MKNDVGAAGDLGPTAIASPRPIRVPLPTPYENEQGDWWIAVEDVPSQEAAREAVAMVAYSGVEFVGVETATLMEGEWGDPEAPSREVPAYHFRDVEACE